MQGEKSEKSGSYGRSRRRDCECVSVCECASVSVGGVQPTSHPPHLEFRCVNVLQRLRWLQDHTFEASPPPGVIPSTRAGGGGCKTGDQAPHAQH